MLMLKPYINNFFIVSALLLLSLSGCTTTSQFDDTLQGDINITAEVRTEFAQALAVLKSGQHAIALQLFQQMAQRYPQLAGIQVNIGIIHLHNKKPDAANAAFKRAIQINPANAAAHHHLGIVYRQSGQFAAAKDAYQQALKFNPEYANAHLNLGILYDIYLQQPAQALEHYQQYQRLSKDDDKQINNWLIDVERRANANKPKTQGGS